MIEEGGRFRMVVNAFARKRCAASVSAARKHEVDQHAVLVDSTEQVLPSGAHLDVGFVYSPGP